MLPVPEPVMDALAALHHLSDIVWDEITNETRNVVAEAMVAAMRVVYAPEPDDDFEADAWHDAWRAAMDERAERLGESERLRVAGLAS